ncbi:hypothetical protein [Leptospira stimsonii]|nr:hypothetical protein [Leptospira stimsonii]
MTSLKNTLYETIDRNDGSYEPVFLSNILSNEFIEDCNWLGENGVKHGTIDVFAKKLYLKRKTNDLKRLKRTLSFFLLFKQMQVPNDNRYDIFLTTVMKLKDEDMYIPDEVILGTWNYDNQILISLLNILGSFELNHALQYINIQPWHKGKSGKEGIPKLFHSNGMAGFVSLPFQTEDFYHFLTKQFNRESAEEFNKIYDKIGKENSAQFQINFAWENVGEIEVARSEFIKSLANVETFVVIGYSFPTFNREYDKRLFKEAKSLKKIYVQDKAPDGIIERVRSLLEEDLVIIPVGGTDQFYIPVELSI